MSSASDLAFFDLALTLQNDPDDDVTLDGSTLLVRGRVFARLDGDALVVELPPIRAADLIGRGMASAVDGGVDGGSISVPDSENWLELATEAHQFVGEPPVGRQS